MKIPEGYKLLVVDPEGTIVEEIDIGEYDLSKQVARGSLVNEIDDAVVKAVGG